MNFVANQRVICQAERTLTPLVLVRIQVPQPTISITYPSENPDIGEQSAYARRTKTGTINYLPAENAKSTDLSRIGLFCSAVVHLGVRL